MSLPVDAASARSRPVVSHGHRSPADGIFARETRLRSVVGATHNTLSRNTANRNTSYGIAVGDGASANTCSYNSAHQDGILDARQYSAGPSNVWLRNSFGTTSGI
jgi:parallel beta-helix repeat protein